MRMRASGALLLTVACCAACSSSGGHSGSQGPIQVQPNGHLTMVIAGDPGNLDPDLAVSPNATQVINFAYDYLLYQRVDGTLATGIADKWSGSGTTYTMHVKPGVKCSDGSTLDARVVAENLNFVGDPANKSPLTGVFLPAGAKATADQGASTVTIKIPSAAPFFFQSLAVVPMICQPGLDNRTSLAHGTDDRGPTG